MRVRRRRLQNAANEFESTLRGPPRHLAMNPAGQQILVNLQEVADQRMLRRLDGDLGARVLAIKAYQHARFMRTYADMLAHPRYGGAAQFFLDDLYGPGDFTSRDDQFARIVPGLVRVFPQQIVSTVVSLSQLHALSERLDTGMGRVLAEVAAAAPRQAATEVCDPVIDGVRYGQCWRRVEGPAAREQQIALMLAVGEALEGYTRNSLLRHSLRLMRRPAHAAGLGALQAFLERGFDTFRAMRGSGEFLDLVANRERALAAALFAGGDGPDLATTS